MEKINQKCKWRHASCAPKTNGEYLVIMAIIFSNTVHYTTAIFEDGRWFRFSVRKNKNGSVFTDVSDQVMFWRERPPVPECILGCEIL